MPVHFCSGSPCSCQLLAGGPGVYAPLVAAGPWTAPAWVLPAFARPSSRPGLDRPWQASGEPSIRQADPAHAGPRSEIELAALREKVTRLAGVLSRHDQRNKR